jgi:hypothetical protein
MEILKLDFTKTVDNHIDLTNTDNLASIRQYILPVMEENVGWGSGDMTAEAFEKNPAQFQDYIDNSLDDNVHVLVNNNEAVGFIEYSHLPYLTSEHETVTILRSVMSDYGDRRWEDIVRTANITKLPDMNEAKSFLQSKPFYYGFGIVLANKFQGKLTSYSKMLYDVVGNGIVSGFTSNPVIVRKRKQVFQSTYYYPLFGEAMDTPEKFACHLYAWADIARHSYNESASFQFGVRQVSHFVNRGVEYVALAQHMYSKAKLTKHDLKKVLYTLNTPFTAGTIISHN